MQGPERKIKSAIGEFLLLTLLALVAPALVFTDVVIIGHGLSEISLTEIAQEVLLLLIALLIALGAWRHAESRGFFLLMAGFYGCMLIRELDGFLDNVQHGFWLWPTLFLAFTTITYVITCCRDTVLVPMANFVDTKPYFYTMVGLIFVLVFSRVFGSRTLLWGPAMGPEYSGTFRNILQEGLELLGYVFIAYGSGLLLWNKNQQAAMKS